MFQVMQSRDKVFRVLLGNRMNFILGKKKRGGLWGAIILNAVLHSLSQLFLLKSGGGGGAV